MRIGKQEPSRRSRKKDIETVFRFMIEASDDLLFDIIQKHGQDIDELVSSYCEDSTEAAADFLDRIEDLTPLKLSTGKMIEAICEQDRPKVAMSSQQLIEIIESRLSDLESAKRTISSVDWNIVCKEFIASLKMDEDLIRIAKEESEERSTASSSIREENRSRIHSLDNTVADLLRDKETLEKRIRASDVLARKSKEIQSAIDKQGRYLRLAKQLLTDYLS